MRVIAKSTLVKFWKQPGHEDARGPLESWHDAALKATWLTPQDVKAQFGQASICGNSRVVINHPAASCGISHRRAGLFRPGEARRAFQYGTSQGLVNAVFSPPLWLSREKQRGKPRSTQHCAASGGECTQRDSTLAATNTAWWLMWRRLMNIKPIRLEPFIGSSGRVSEILNRKRRLSLGMVKRLHEGLHIPYESLMGAVA